ncbi:MAG: PKD domain-containing protein [Candidatus Bipolaricaulis sp.]|nr:PKD domain-containing protein [Candidatus Bipolaricaulis sp.]
MRRIACVAVLAAGLIGAVSGCTLNARLDACFRSLQAPDGGPLTMLFDASCSTYYEAPLGVGYIFEWHFGDGQMQRVYDSVLVTYTYPEPGTYTVELLVIGWDGEMARARHGVEVGAP